jgi:hypothetical protein
MSMKITMIRITAPPTALPMRAPVFVEVGWLFGEAEATVVLLLVAKLRVVLDPVEPVKLVPVEASIELLWMAM